MPVDHLPLWYVYFCEYWELQDVHHHYEEAEVQEDEGDDEDFSSI